MATYYSGYDTTNMNVRWTNVMHNGTGEANGYATYHFGPSETELAEMKEKARWNKKEND